MTAIMSISHRATGVFLSAGMFILVLLLAALADGPSSWNLVHGLLTGWFGQLILFGFSLVLNYHLFHGIHHLIWDVGHGYSLEATSRTNLMVLIATVVLTLLLWVVALSGV